MALKSKKTKLKQRMRDAPSGARYLWLFKYYYRRRQRRLRIPKEFFLRRESRKKKLILSLLNLVLCDTLEQLDEVAVPPIESSDLNRSDYLSRFPVLSNGTLEQLNEVAVSSTHRIVRHLE